MTLFQIIFLIYGLSVVRAVQLCGKDIYDTVFHTASGNIDVFIIWYPVRAGVHNTLRLCSSNSGLPIERSCSYNRAAANATWEDFDRGMEYLNCSTIADKCVEETFEHVYVMKNNVIKRHTNQWPAAKLGELATSKEPCLLETGLPLTRKCLYNQTNHAAEWEEKDYKNTKCLRDIQQNIVTYDLKKLYEDTKVKGAINGTESLRVARNLTNILTKTSAVRIANDLEISTNIMQLITISEREPAMVAKVLNVTNLLMTCDDNVVLNSNELGTPKKLIDTVETYLDSMTNNLMPTSKCNDVPEGVIYESENLTSLFVINPACSNISGVAVYKASAHQTPSIVYDQPTNTYFRYLYSNQSLDEIRNEPHVEVATFIPEALWKTLLKETTGKNDVQAVRVSLYRNKNFFVDKENSRRKPEDIILKITIPGYEGDLPADVPLIFQHLPTDRQEKPLCGYYSNDIWISNGDSTTNNRNSVLCNTRQSMNFLSLIGLTSVGQHVGNSKLSVQIDFALFIISFAGCALSLFGIMCVGLTAMCFKQWRSDSIHQLLLNVCFVLALIMVYFLFISIPDLRKNMLPLDYHCMAEGIFLHYTVLVLFVWMFFMAIEQYREWVYTMGLQRSRNLVVSYALAAWGLPFIAIALVMYLDPKSYMPHAENETICYPSGHSFYYAVLLPIGVVIVANIGIFIYILCRIRASLNRPIHLKQQHEFAKQVHIAILLFFLLGLSWVFGVLAHIVNHIAISVLFCLTSTLQGFVLFVYFVVLDRKTRFQWLKYCCGKNYNSSSTNTSSRSKSQMSQNY